MACGTDYLGMWTDIAVWDAARCTFQNTLGPAFPLVVVLFVGTAYALFSEGRPTLPIVLVMLMGSVVITLLPGSIVTAIVALTLLSLAVGVYTLYKRASDTPV